MKGEIDYAHLIRLTLSGNKEAYSELYDKTIQEVYKTAHQTVLVKTKSSGGITVDEVPEACKERFIKAEQFMEYVNEKVR
ncbi:DUF3600 domain-containing protein [Bacillus cereus]|uniref:DUF3600 domain-containing protein n=1 Tax=Bacillus cereus TaxID=1396 RepID=A0A2A9TV13_BACCE|nr:DUF3600 domain-containing protein [Bacillus cereus]EJS67650.1 hypothetical protein ICU_02876 [Bacillus cereus BAG2X1-1]EJS75952.1 hypothetical protein ICY_02703 [Bacillus cereus BAG2X1-3]PEA11455.1 DUF3600 domain-containing protein [Bacillus cereus]PEW00175.1 DUF3600 domain-containing protein [Bacillus cereus]PFI15639.1 DUF3600 domain-containing protein [Bacillus cereus]